MTEIIPAKAIQQKIYLVRGHKVMLDKDLAILYGVKPIRLREQVKRNIKRFPGDFMFRINSEEVDLMVSQNAIPSRKHLGGHNPYVFSEQGVAMLATVLNSERAILVNIEIMRTFVKLRAIFLTHKQLASKLNQLERQIGEHDKGIHTIFEALRQLMTPLEKKKRNIGFNRE